MRPDDVFRLFGATLIIPLWALLMRRCFTLEGALRVLEERYKKNRRPPPARGDALFVRAIAWGFLALWIISWIVLVALIFTPWGQQLRHPTV